MEIVVRLEQSLLDHGVPLLMVHIAAHLFTEPSMLILTIHEVVIFGVRNLAALFALDKVPQDCRRVYLPNLVRIDDLHLRVREHHELQHIGRGDVLDRVDDVMTLVNVLHPFLHVRSHEVIIADS